MSQCMKNVTHPHFLAAKILVIGDYGVGKTSIIRRYTEGSFSANYKLTIGVDFALKTVERQDCKITLQLWDIAGHERFGHMTSGGFGAVHPLCVVKYAIGAIIVFDLGRPATFESVSKWLRDLNDKVMLPSGQPMPTLLLANKSDSSSAEVDKAKLHDFCERNGFLAWFATSAKSNTNIDAAMDCLVDAIVALPKETLETGPALDQFIRVDGSARASDNSGKPKCCEG